MTKEQLTAELERLERELEWPVSHKRIAELQEQIEDIESELRKLEEANG